MEQPAVSKHEDVLQYLQNSGYNADSMRQNPRTGGLLGHFVV